MLLHRKVKVKSLSRVRFLAAPWTAAYQAPPSVGFSRQEYWSGLPFPSPEDLPDPGIEPGSPALQADALPSKPPGESVHQEAQKKKPSTKQKDNLLNGKMYLQIIYLIKINIPSILKTLKT